MYLDIDSERIYDGVQGLAIHTENPKAQILSETLDRANGKYLGNNKSPSRKVHEIDNRGTHFYVALYWAQELAAQDNDAELKEKFTPVAKVLSENEEQIMKELDEAQGKPQAYDGYYLPNDEIASVLMRASKTLNSIIDSL